ncbi:hypothetical protein RUM43_007809 [Polyplax serrata]|uniref:Cyclin C-terminal domain-containing protein n=1 Tax=Polyplax serrata TaxID=468196 RepID=A0AAN8PDP2_POLSC
MEPVSKKRKLADYGTNVTPLRRTATIGDGGTINQGENETNACKHHRHGFVEEQESELVTKEDTDATKTKMKSNHEKRIVLQGKEAPKKLPANVGLNEKVVEKTNRTKERLIYNEEAEEDEDEAEDDEDEDEDEDDEELEEEEEDEEESRTQGGNPGDNCDRREIMWFSTDYIEDIITHEMNKEAAYHLSVNFCREFDINPTGREILIDWLISVQVHLKAENSALHLTVALLDIMLDRVHIPINELQAAAVAAFWVAYKYIHGSLSMKALLNLCAGSVTKSMIEGNEILVLQTSRLIQAGGSLTVFFNYLLHKIFGFKFPPEIYYCGLYFIEIMLLQFVFVDCPAYEKAVTAVFTALAVFGCPDRFAHVDISNFISKRKLLHVYRRLMRSLRLMYNDRDALKKSNVYRKYKSSRYFKISIHQSLKCLATA